MRKLPYQWDSKEIGGKPFLALFATITSTSQKWRAIIHRYFRASQNMIVRTSIPHRGIPGHCRMVQRATDGRHPNTRLLWRAL
jgi:hypothetical protein